MQIDINELIGNSNFFPISSSFGGKIYGFAISIGFNEISFNDLEIFKIGLTILAIGSNILSNIENIIDLINSIISE